LKMKFDAISYILLSTLFPLFMILILETPKQPKKNKRYKGFTLVELIVVITILVILWTIAFLNLWGFQSHARDSVRIENLTNLKKWLDIFQIKSGKYPLPEKHLDLPISSDTNDLPENR
jgi:general secretion pathway protein G